ncbi:hypothetical protein ABZ154_33980, partial [Streptomyces sp. NPDC006261]
NNFEAAAADITLLADIPAGQQAQAGDKARLRRDSGSPRAGPDHRAAPSRAAVCPRPPRRP